MCGKSIGGVFRQLGANPFGVLVVAKITVLRWFAGGDGQYEFAPRIVWLIAVLEIGLDANGGIGNGLAGGVAGTIVGHTGVAGVDKLGFKVGGEVDGGSEGEGEGVG